MSAIETKLNYVNTQLANDPYQIDLLFEKVLLNLVSGNLPLAEQAYNSFSKLPGVEVHSKLLSSLIDGTNDINFDSHCWYVFPTGSSAEKCELIMSLAQSHYQSLQALKQTAESSIIIFEVSASAASLLDYSLSGVNYIRLSGLLDTYEKFSAAIAHELTHVFLPCKNRVLSEGVALNYETTFAPEASFIKSYQSAVEYLQDHKQLVPSLEILLSRNFSNDVFFTKQTSSTDEQFLIYNMAFVLIYQFLKHRSHRELAVLLDRVNDGQEVDTYTVFTSFFPQPLETVFLDIPVAEKRQVDLDYAQIESRIRADRLSNQQTSYDDYYNGVSSLEEGTVHPDKNTVLRARLLLIRLYQQVSNKAPIDFISLALVEQLSEKLMKGQYSSEAKYFSAKAKLLRLLVSQDAIEKYELLPEIEMLFEQSMVPHTLLSESSIDYAKFKLSTPEPFDKELPKVKEIIYHIETDERYSSEVALVKEQIAAVI